MPQDCHRSQVMEPEAKVGLGNGGLGIERDTARKNLRTETDQEVLVSAFNNPGSSVASCTGVANSEWLVVSFITLKRYVKLTLCVELVHISFKAWRNWQGKAATSIYCWQLAGLNEKESPDDFLKNDRILWYLNWSNLHNDLWNYMCV